MEEDFIQSVSLRMMLNPYIFTHCGPVWKRFVSKKLEYRGFESRDSFGEVSLDKRVDIYLYKREREGRENDLQVSRLNLRTDEWTDMLLNTQVYPLSKALNLPMLRWSSQM